MRRYLATCTGALAVYLGMGVVPAVMAQTTPAADTPRELPGVTISVTRTDGKNFETPASVDVVSRAQIEDAKLQVNLSEVLGAVPGLVANNRGNYAQDLQISSRGFGARTAFGVRGIRIYVDGIPGNSPDGQGQVSHIDLGSAKQIEVLRGPFSSIYGNSSGGVINVTTQEGGPDTVSTTSLTGGSFGSYRLGQKVSGSSGAFNYVLDASRYSTDGWRDHSAAQKDNINARLGFKLGADTQAVLVLNRVNLPDAQDAQGVNLAGLATPKAVPAAVLDFNTRKSTAQTQLGLALDHRFNADHSVKLMGYGGTRDITQFLSVPVGAQGNTSAGGVIDFGRNYKGMEGRYTFKRNLANGPLLVHAGFTSDRLVEERRGFNNFIGTTLGVQGDPKRDETNTLKANDQYLQAQWWPAADVSLHAGVRRTRVGLQSEDRFIAPGPPPNPNDSGSLAFSGTTPMLGLLYNLNDRVNVYASWGRGFDAPTLNEVAYEPGGASGLNLTLKPSRSQQFELGAKFQLAQSASLQAAVFQAKTEDEIVVLSNNGGRSRFQNAGGTQRDGLELAYNGQFAKGWKTQLAYTYINATYRDPFKACFTTTCSIAPNAAPANQPVPVAAGNL
ncbi:MAG: TonB-dependent receptor, partial [Burkholderiaceae bacterium]